MSSLSPSSIPPCLVCGTPTAATHFGVDVCRPCTVFYRRSRKNRQYVCRAIDSRCEVTQNGASGCKRCRFERFERILSQSRATAHQELDRQSMPFDLNRNTASRTRRPLLDKAATCYKMLCAMRRSSEIDARQAKTPVTLSKAAQNAIAPSTYESLNNTCRFLLTGVHGLAETLYPEFASFTREEQWELSVKFVKRIFLFDAAFRAEKLFPDDTSKCLGACTSYMSVESVDHFFSNCPGESSNIEKAKEVLKQFVGTVFPIARAAIKRANLDEEEFNTVLVLMFWFADSMPMRDEIVQTGDKYRKQILSELQAHYREDLNMNDYAARIGELFTLIFHFDRTTEVDEQFEMFRLWEVFSDDTFVYRLETRLEMSACANE